MSDNISVLSLFSGIGAFEKALKNLGIDYRLVNYCEIDKYASKSYCAIHDIDKNLNLLDVTKIDTSKLPVDIDLLTHGSPCQSFSIAGKQEGGDKDSGTKSSLMWETVRIIKDIKPKIIIWENVRNVLSKKHIHNFNAYIDILTEYNYNSYYKILNAKDFGIPQNRERVFVVSVRTDIDNNLFEFPDGFPLKLRLKDVLDDEVDEKYYLKLKDTSRFKFLESSNESKGCKQVGFLDRPTTHDFSNRVYSPDGLARTLMGSGGNCNDKAGQYLIEPKINRIDIPQTVKVRKYEINCKLLCECLRDHKAKFGLSNKKIAEKLNVPMTMVEHWFRKDKYFAIPDADIWFKLKSLLGIETDEFDAAITTFEEKEGVYEKSERHYFVDGIAPTLTSTSARTEKFIENPNGNGLRIRKLTPKECFRLMGFDDEDYEKVRNVNSETQLYKQAGNSIVVPVIEHIMMKLFECNVLKKHNN